MWYFSWLLGLPLAVAFAVLNAMWYELMDDKARKRIARDPTAELARADHLTGVIHSPGIVSSATKS